MYRLSSSWVDEVLSAARRMVVAVWLPALLAACAESAPQCPFQGPAAYAPSAGCFAVAGGGLLVVQGLNGMLSLPGGSSQDGEAAQCTAFRETWEETGLQLQPLELLQVFDTGFQLYRCQSHGGSGRIDPPLRMEVRQAMYLQPARFMDYEWRFPEQAELLLAMLAAEDRR